MAAFWGVVLAVISIVCAITAPGFYSHGLDSSAFLFGIGAILSFAGAAFIFIKYYTKGNRLTYAKGEVTTPWFLIFVVSVAIIIIVVFLVLLLRGFSRG